MAQQDPGIATTEVWKIAHKYLSDIKVKTMAIHIHIRSLTYVHKKRLTQHHLRTALDKMTIGTSALDPTIFAFTSGFFAEISFIEEAMRIRGATQ
jgi:hypothetical protein